jgi:molybdate transport system permease protein
MDAASFFSLRLSLQVAFCSTLLVAAAGIPLAYLLARKPLPGREVLDMLCTLPLVLPPTVTGYYLVVVFGRNGFAGSRLHQWTGWSIMFTWQAAALASFVVALPLMIKTARAALESVDGTLIDASRTLGHSELWTAIRVTLPLARRGIIAGIVLAFARSLGEFGATLMLAGNIPGRTDTMPVAIYSAASSGEWQKAGSMVAVFTLLSGALLYAANRLTARRA